MRVLVDTNIIVDYVADRKPFSEDAFIIMKLCADKKIEGCIAAHTISKIACKLNVQKSLIQILF